MNCNVKETYDLRGAKVRWARGVILKGRGEGEEDEREEEDYEETRTRTREKRAGERTREDA